VNEQESLQPEPVFVAMIQYVPSGSPDTVWLNVCGNAMKFAPVLSWNVQPAPVGFTVADGLLQLKLMFVHCGPHTAKFLATVNEQESLQPEPVFVAMIQYVPSGSPDTVWLNVCGNAMKFAPVLSWNVQPAPVGLTVADGLLQLKLMFVHCGPHTAKFLATVNEQESLQPEPVLVAMIQYVPFGSPETVCVNV